MRNKQSGVTRVEVIVAILLLSTGALGLAASSAVITRQMTINLLRSRSANIARERSERAHAAACSGLSGGNETKDGIRASWTVSTGPVATIDQDLERRSRNEMHFDRFLSAVPCG